MQRHYICLLVETYFVTPGGTKIVMITINTAKPYEIKIEIKLKFFKFEKTSTSSKYLKIDMADIKKNNANKKKCNNIPIASHHALLVK
jgi:hypothetical protein